MDKHETKPTLASMPQVIDMQRLAGKAFINMPKSKANQILRTDASQKAFMKKLSELCNFQIQNEQALVAIPLLIDYYNKVYGIDISDIAEMEFPEHATFQTFMAVSPKLDEDQIMMSLREYFKIELYRYKEPVAKNINRDEEAKIQKRPSGLYVFAHSGQDEPDTNHRNKSYDDAVAEKITFANAKEYLLMTGFHKFIKGYFMDKKGWTRTSSLWVGGNLVLGNWSDANSKLYLRNGGRDYGHADDGPRELFLTL